MTKYVARLGLAVILLVALLAPLSLPVQADDSEDFVDLVLGGEGASLWRILYIVPGDSGIKTVTLHNAGNVDGVVTIWISDLTSTEGDNPEPETDIEGEGELDDYLLFNFSCARLSTNISLPATIRELPQDPSDGRYLRVKPVGKGETVTLEWLWELPKETGNDVMGDCISFTINYVLQKLEGPPPPSPSPPSPEGEEIRAVTEVRAIVCAYRITQLTLSPYEVNVDEPVTVGVLITNPCDEPQSCEVVLKVNGVVEASKRVVVEPHETKQVLFTTSKHSGGTYSVEVNGYYAGTFVVKEVIFPAPPPMPKPFPWWLILIIALAAAALASLITYLVSRRKRKQAGGSPGD